MLFSLPPSLVVLSSLSSLNNNPRTNDPRDSRFGHLDVLDLQQGLLPRTTQNPINETAPPKGGGGGQHHTRRGGGGSTTQRRRKRKPHHPEEEEEDSTTREGGRENNTTPKRSPFAQKVPLTGRGLLPPKEVARQHHARGAAPRQRRRQGKSAPHKRREEKAALAKRRKRTKLRGGPPSSSGSCRNSVLHLRGPSYNPRSATRSPPEPLHTRNHASAPRARLI